jgi:hypothetical protein
MSRFHAGSCLGGGSEVQQGVGSASRFLKQLKHAPAQRASNSSQVLHLGHVMPVAALEGGWSWHRHSGHSTLIALIWLHTRRLILQVRYPGQSRFRPGSC